MTYSEDSLSSFEEDFEPVPPQQINVLMEICSCALIAGKSVDILVLFLERTEMSGFKASFLFFLSLLISELQSRNNLPLKNDRRVHIVQETSMEISTMCYFTLF